MTPLYRRICGWLGGLLAFGLIAAAVLLTVLRLALPLVGDYRAELEQRVADYLDVPVSIGSMQVEWHGLGPRLRLLDIEIEGPTAGGTPVHFDEALVDIGFAFGADRRYPLRISTVALIGCAVEVELTESGQVAVLGARMPAERLIPTGDGPPPLVRRIADWLLGVDGLRVRDTEVTFVRPDGRRALVGNIRASALNTGRAHQLTVSMDLPDGWGERVSATLEASGGAFGAWETWNGRVHVDARGIELAQWFGLYDDLPVRARDGRADLALWADFGAGHIGEITARGQVDGLELASAADAAPVRFQRLGGLLRWQQDPRAGWQVDVGDLVVQREGRQWPAAAGMSVARDPETAAATWRIGGQSMRVEDAAALARFAPIPDDLAAALRRYRPQGEVHSLSARLVSGGALDLRARLEDAAWQAAGPVPGASGVDAQVRWDRTGGRIALATESAVVDAPHILPEPLPISHAEGELRVERDSKGGWRLRSDRLELANEDVRGSTRLDIAYRPDGGVMLDIAADFGDGDLAAAPRYLPHGPIPEQVLAEVRRVLRDGRISQATLRLQGRARDFPYRDGNGRFELEGRVEDATLAYARGWPALEEVAGRVRFEGAGLTIRAERARLFGIEAGRVDARIPDLERGDMEVTAQADAPVADLVRLINESPLATDLGRLFDGARGDGRAPLSLRLQIPLRDPAALEVEGAVELAGADLVQPRFDLDLRDLQGKLGFSRRGVQMSGLEARLRGRPVVLNARILDGAHAVNRIRVSGRFGLGDLLGGLDPGLGQRIEGRADWNLELRIPHRGDDPAVLSGVSDLRGMRVDLPAPLGKPRERARRLAFSIPLRAGTEPLPLRLDYAEDIRALVEIQDEGGGFTSNRATVRFGAGDLALHGEPGLNIAGVIERLDVGAWIASAMAGTGEEAAAIPALNRLDVRVERLGAGALALRDVALEVTAGERGWSLDVASEAMVGGGRIPQRAGAGKPLRLRFERIDLGAMLAAGGDSDAGDSAPGISGLDPRQIPALDIRVDRLALRNGILRDLSLVTSPATEALVVHRLAFANEALEMKGQGRWRGPDPHQSSLRLSVSGEDFGAGLERLGYSGAMVDGKGEVSADLTWQDVPWSPAYRHLGGHVKIDLADGAIPEMDTGAARLLGMLSLSALPQMLSLDFSGFTQKGYPFDTISGRVDLEQGNAYSRGLKIDGPAGKMVISGRTGLVARDYDQTIRFQPQLSNSLPLISGLAGGPVAGVAVAVIQGIMRNVGADVEKASEMRFALTGSWDEPKVERVGDEQEAEQEPQQTRGGP